MGWGQLPAEPQWGGSNVLGALPTAQQGRGLSSPVDVTHACYGQVRVRGQGSGTASALQAGDGRSRGRRWRQAEGRPVGLGDLGGEA